MFYRLMRNGASQRRKITTMSDAKIDTMGCPEFFVDASSIEITGTNVRLSFGVHRGDHVEGVFSMVMPAEVAMICSKVCQQVSQTVYTAIQIGEGKPVTH